MNGFFNRRQTGTLIVRKSSCTKCGLHQNCISPRMEPTGEGRKKIFILAEAPGRVEDEEGTQLVGKSGQLLRKHLHQLGIELDRDCRKMNAVNCRPKGNKPPSSTEIQLCRPRVLREIDRLKPRVLILLGSVAVESVIGNRWTKNLGGITRWRGWRIPDSEYGCWLCPTFHPSFVLREWKNPACELIFKQDLKNSIKMLEKELPTFVPPENKIRIILNKTETVQYLRKVIRDKPPVIAFDFETTGLKPHRKEQRIVCCSIATNSTSATSFLTKDVAVLNSLKRILANPEIKKVGANIKYEHNWSREKLGVEVKGWVHDVCIYQHILDNRPGICSVKFMSYVYFGVADYDSHISAFLKVGKNGNDLNDVDRIPIEDLLAYNAIDSKLELRIYEKQITQ